MGSVRFLSFLILWVFSAYGNNTVVCGDRSKFKPPFIIMDNQYTKLDAERIGRMCAVVEMGDKPWGKVDGTITGNCELCCKDSMLAGLLAGINKKADQEVAKENKNRLNIASPQMTSNEEKQFRARIKDDLVKSYVKARDSVGGGFGDACKNSCSSCLYQLGTNKSAPLCLADSCASDIPGFNSGFNENNKASECLTVNLHKNCPMPPEHPSKENEVPRVTTTVALATPANSSNGRIWAVFGSARGFTGVVFSDSKQFDGHCCFASVLTFTEEGNYLFNRF